MSHSNPDSWVQERLLQNILVVISAATAANYGMDDNQLLIEDLPNADYDEHQPYLYRIGASYSLACTLLERLCEETGETPLEVLQDLGLKTNWMLSACQAGIQPSHPRNPPEDPPNPPPPLEPA
jgi:hypothetical protein